MHSTNNALLTVFFAKLVIQKWNFMYRTIEDFLTDWNYEAESTLKLFKNINSIVNLEKYFQIINIIYTKRP